MNAASQGLQEQTEGKFIKKFIIKFIRLVGMLQERKQYRAEQNISGHEESGYQGLILPCLPSPTINFYKG